MSSVEQLEIWNKRLIFSIGILGLLLVVEVLTLFSVDIFIVSYLSEIEGFIHLVTIVLALLRFRIAAFLYFFINVFTIPTILKSLYLLWLPDEIHVVDMFGINMDVRIFFIDVVQILLLVLSSISIVITLYENFGGKKKIG